MRKDLAQLLCEHPRYNPRRETYRTVRRCEKDYTLEHAPTKESMSGEYVEKKEFGEFFPPLMGILRKNEGRPWDKVYSEIMGSLRGGGAVIEHVRLHLLRDFVIREPIYKDGVACYPPHSLRYSLQGEPVPLEGVHYVDAHGILRTAPQRKRVTIKGWWNTAPDNVFARVCIDAESAYYLLPGGWFKVWVKPLPKDGLVSDLLLGKAFLAGARGWDRADLTALKAAHGRYVYSYRKQQVGSREIKRQRLNERR